MPSDDERSSHPCRSYPVTDPSHPPIQRFLFDAGSCPYRVLAKGSENHLAVVAPQEAVDRKQAFGTQVEADGIDELHHIIACESGKEP